MKLQLKSLPKWQVTLALAASVALLGWLALPLWRLAAPAADTNAPQPSPTREPASSPPAARARVPIATPPSAAHGAPGPSSAAEGATATATSADAALAALASGEPSARIEALRALRERRETAALPRLLELDPQRDPEVAPTLIQVVSALATQADAPRKSAAALSLGRWLRAETQREGADARGNLATLVEALAALDSREAVVSLIDALDGGRLPTHVATVAVEGLARIGDPSAQQAIARFRQQLDASPEATGFARELHDEAARAADQALARLAR